MNKTLRAALVAAVVAICTALPLPAHAVGSALGVKITSIMVIGTQHAVLTIAGPIGTRPACAVSTNGMVMDVATSKGRALLSLAQSAFLADLFVTIQGTGTCTTPTGSSAAENLATLVMAR
jgi:hypothetical protein